jgi:hypothetical protein
MMPWKILRKWPSEQINLCGLETRCIVPLAAQWGCELGWKVVLTSSLFISQIAFANSYIVDLVTDPKAIKVSSSTVVTEMSKAQLISIGETHSHGLEREAIRDLYVSLQKVAKSRADCFVETFDNLMPANDVVRDSFLKLCKKTTSVLGNGPLQTVFEKPMAKSFGKSVVLTHSGFRHVMPMGRIFPGDFVAAAIDTKANNTISTQIPSKYVGKTKMVTLTFLDIADLPTFMLRNELTSLITEKSKLLTVDEQKSLIAKRLKEIEQRISVPTANLLDQFNKEQKVLYYQLAEMQSLSKPKRTSFLSLYSEDVYKPAVFEQLLQSQELADFILQVTSTDGLYVRIAKSETDFDGTAIEASGIFLFNSSGRIFSHPSGKVELVLK